MEESEQDSVDNSISVIRHKIFFVGDNMVGKTRIIFRILNIEYHEHITLGTDLLSKKIRYRGQNIELQIWDTNGSERNKIFLPSYIRNSSIVFVVYDISYKNSFDHVPSWINFIKSLNNPIIILCGNKIDLNTRYRKVEKKRRRRIC